jgi:hypothetical protein
MKEGIVGKVVYATTTLQIEVKGSVILVYSDAIASGVRDYVSVTYLMVVADDGTVHQVMPRYVYRIETV